MLAFLLLGVPVLAGCTSTDADKDAAAEPRAESKERERPQKKRDIDIEKEWGDEMDGPGLFSGDDGGFYLIGEPGEEGEDGDASRKREDGPIKVRERR